MGVHINSKTTDQTCRFYLCIECDASVNIFMQMLLKAEDALFNVVRYGYKYLKKKNRTSSNALSKTTIKINKNR